VRHGGLSNSFNPLHIHLKKTLDVTKHNSGFSILRIALILFFQPQFANAQNDLLKVAQSLQKSEGKVTTYYPESIKAQAKSIQVLLEKAVDFYDKRLGIKFPISIVLFGPKEYAQYTKDRFGKADPYNEFLPFVAPGPPKVICLPAIGGSALDSLTQMALKKSSTVKKLSLSIPEISLRFTALVGLHELGHQYIEELEIFRTVHWFDEMLANFIADAFLTDVAPSDALLWQEVMTAYETNLRPVNRTFSGIHKGNQENYVWWQGNVTTIAHEVYKKQGFDFLQNLRMLSNVKIYHEDDLSFIIALDEIAPGFHGWAKKYGHITEADKKQMDSIENKVRNETKNLIAQNMPNIYTALHSNEWQNGSLAYKNSVMKFLKDFETNNFKQEDLLAEFIWLQLNEANDFFEKRKAIEKLKEFRTGLSNLKIKLQSIIPVKSVDSDEDWVFVSGSMTTTQENGRPKSIHFFNQFRINKEGKINLIKQYEFAAK